MKKKTVFVYTDGGSRGNPGISGAGVFICDETGIPLKEISKFLGTGTNNVAEYQAVIIGLEGLKKMFGAQTNEMHFEFRMDSELIQRQLMGVYKVKHPDMKACFETIQKMKLAHFPHINFVHVRREHNKEADRLANEAMDRKS